MRDLNDIGPLAEQADSRASKINQPAAQHIQRAKLNGDRTGLTDRQD